MSEIDTAGLGFDSGVDAAVKRILEHLPMKGNTVLTLLKGHLLIEETLRKFINKKVPNRNAIEEAQLSFHQTCCMVKALYKPQGMEWLWVAVKRLNKLRNDLAHNLEPVGFDDRINKLRVFVNESTGMPDPLGMQDQMGDLAVTFATLIAFIHVGLEPMPFPPMPESVNSESLAVEFVSPSASA